VIGAARSEDGFTLVELLVSMTLMIIVLGATLTSFDVFGSTQSRNTKLNDAQEVARLTIDRLAVQLRNLANPSNPTITTIDKASSYRLIFQTTDPNKRWVSYCLATSGNGAGIVPAASQVTATPDNGILYFQSNTASSVTTAMEGGATNLCPATGWTTTQVHAQNVVNQRPTNPNAAAGAGNPQLDRPVFTYNTCSSGAASCLSQITDVNAILWIDIDTKRLPVETQISTGVYLRNQNQPPTAAYAATQNASDPRTWLFNGTISSDPEGRTLIVQWYKGPAGATLSGGQLPDCITAQTNTVSGNTWTCIGSTPLLNYTFPSADGNSQTVYLKVTDPGGLPALCSKSATLNATAAGFSCP
jgi:type II secretory pathway pseudopilin PulG